MNFTADRTHSDACTSMWSIGAVIVGSALLASLIEPHYAKPAGVAHPAVQLEQRVAPVSTTTQRRLAGVESHR